MPSTQESLQDCMKLCWDCRHECQTMLFTHCLNEGEKHTEPEHVRLMMDCIEICQTSADFMARESDLHNYVCAACAEICEACAKSCEEIGDEKMRKCAELCRKCAQSCRAMGQQLKKAA